jgi:hypothetical protein
MFTGKDMAQNCLSQLAEAILSHTFTCVHTLAMSSQLSFLLTPPRKLEQTECSRILARDAGESPKRKNTTFRKQQTLKSRNIKVPEQRLSSKIFDAFSYTNMSIRMIYFNSHLTGIDLHLSIKYESTLSIIYNSTF